MRTFDTLVKFFQFFGRNRNFSCKIRRNWPSAVFLVLIRPFVAEFLSNFFSKWIYFLRNLYEVCLRRCFRAKWNFYWLIIFHILGQNHRIRIILWSKLTFWCEFRKNLVCNRIIGHNEILLCYVSSKFLLKINIS